MFRRDNYSCFPLAIDISEQEALSRANEKANRIGFNFVLEVHRVRLSEAEPETDSRESIVVRASQFPLPQDMPFAVGRGELQGEPTRTSSPAWEK
ncbi:MAG: hypothetical protein DWQ01_15655 [Planctomycetota bacterium]|nr:MAG: hypothetical protein DWQ01_15655 [Planctomycetota bacterium]